MVDDRLDAALEDLRVAAREFLGAVASPGIADLKDYGFWGVVKDGHRVLEAAWRRYVALRDL